MRLLYVVRLFSGLVDGIRGGRWAPRGVPTIYRMIESLDVGDHDVRFIFTAKDFDTDWPHHDERTLALDGLRHAVTVVAAGRGAPAALGRARGYLREWQQCRAVCRLYREFGPDLVYFDRVNIYAAALLARRTATPVVWRVMGVPPAMHDMLELRDPVARVTRWAYRSPFALVVCSRDGSGGEAWMERALDPATPRRMMLNGVDLDAVAAFDDSALASQPAGATRVLFVARLVEHKGCLEFVAAVCAALAAEPDGFVAIIAGGGPFEAPMRTAAAAHGCADRFVFLGQLPHQQILALHRRCDIYVSLNPMGNLTNANLEAMKAGACMIMPAAQTVRGIDADTAALMPDDAVWRIDGADNVDALAGALAHLRANPDERRQRAAATAARAAELIPGWHKRIAEEIALLEATAGGC